MPQQEKRDRLAQRHSNWNRIDSILHASPTPKGKTRRAIVSRASTAPVNHANLVYVARISGDNWHVAKSDHTLQLGEAVRGYLISSVRQMHPYSLAEVRAAVAEAARRIVCDQLIQQAGKKLVFLEHNTEGTPLRALARRNPEPAPAAAQTSVPIIVLKSLECHLAMSRDGITMKTLILFRLASCQNVFP